jgi:hypothetical protein
VDGRNSLQIRSGNIYETGCNIPVGWAGLGVGFSIERIPADEPGSESTAASFAFNIPVRDAARYALD